MMKYAKRTPGQARGPRSAYSHTKGPKLAVNHIMIQLTNGFCQIKNLVVTLSEGEPGIIL